MKSPIDEAQQIGRRLLAITHRESRAVAKTRRKYETLRQDLVRGASAPVQRVLEVAGLWPANNLPADSPPVEAEADPPSLGCQGDDPDISPRLLLDPDPLPKGAIREVADEPPARLLPRSRNR
jgi:hypothetical protein